MRKTVKPTRATLEARIAALEAKIRDLEARPQIQFIPYQPVQAPGVQVQPYPTCPNPYYPSVTWGGKTLTPSELQAQVPQWQAQGIAPFPLATGGLMAPLKSLGMQVS